MDRHTRLTSFYLGIFFTLFFSTYTISVYKPTPIVDEMINLTKELIEKVEPMNCHHALSSPEEHYWVIHKECLKTYLNTFEHGVENISQNIHHHEVKNITKHIINCIKILKEHCKIMKEEDGNNKKCKKETRKKSTEIFMDNFLNFSNYLNSHSFCTITMHYKDYYVNESLPAC